jgi:hypothetical protein
MVDGTSDAVENTTLEGPAAAWLSERADELDVSAEELLERVVAAYRAAEAGDVSDVLTEAEFEERLDEVEAEFQAELTDVTGGFESELTDLDSEFSEKVQDVRDRVIQVKRETDAKAPADHDHQELADQARDALAAVDELEAEVVDVADATRRLSERVDAGFENFEEVLTYLRDETDDLDRKLTTLATAVLAMRESVASVAAANARRERTDSLKHAANRAGVRVADCEACGSEVSVGLLTAPECPACGATFEDVEVNEGWFGTHQLLTGSAPALTSGESPPDDEDDDWLGADTDTLEAMASGDANSDDGPDIVEPSDVEDPEPAHESEGAQAGGGENEFRVDDAVDVSETELDASDYRLDVDDEELDLGDEPLDLDDAEDSDVTADRDDADVTADRDDADVTADRDDADVTADRDDADVTADGERND